ncbi:MAG: DUF4157 domain-containing protein [Ardenticatenaceae bacterium]|nr:DUF4157 domain-containing protein [Ardenticatenaceae bacterium]MCB8986858.1 DUF4157 domain-containing protein [Ardenticatenaceae bacterium]
MKGRVTAVFYWLAERLRDASMWPINLVRDLPLRLSRLLSTLWRGIRGLVYLLPEWSQTPGEARAAWGRWKLGRFVDGLHQLLVHSFDLLGGPEIAQFFMHLIARTTPLTGSEIAMFASVLGPDALRFGDVRVAEGGLFELVFKYNGNLAFATWHTINLPRSGRHTRANLPVVVHELTHVYQYERVGSRYLGEAIYMLIKTKRDCYNYGGAAGLQLACQAGKCFGDFNREQQAKITQDYFVLREKGSDVTAYEPFMAQVRAGEL